MRYPAPTSANFTRGYAWWIMTEAKARNPHIETYGLAESWPRWVHGPNASTSVGPLDDPQLSAQYITEWVKGAKDVHNLTIDWVGMWNEHWEAPAVMYAYTMQLRAQLDAAGLQATRIIGPDAFSGASETLAQKIIQDPSGIGAAVDAIGVHGGPVADPSNPNGSATWRSGKKLYASEDGSTYGDVPGALSLSLSLSLCVCLSPTLCLQVRSSVSSTCIWSTLNRFLKAATSGTHSRATIQGYRLHSTL